mmetsp:Transcript_62552/g.191332  ORF Transcript_62552/g.191332 Transcript_62552/m.191332 type:complete len:481 (+) Transcript_62552:72-1514(+)
MAQTNLFFQSTEGVGVGHRAQGTLERALVHDDRRQFPPLRGADCALDLHELIERKVHESGKPGDHLLVLVEQQRDVQAPGVAPQPHAAFHELPDAQGIGFVGVQQDPQRLGLRDVELHRFEVRPHVRIAQVPLELLPAEEAGGVGIGLHEEALDVQEALPLHGLLVLDHDLAVLHRDLLGTVDEHRRDDVENPEDDEEDVQHEREAVHDVDVHQRSHDVAPIRPAGDPHEERQQALFDGPKELLDLRVLIGRRVDLVREELAHAEQDEHREHVDHKKQQREDPEQRQERVHDGVHHHAEALELLHHSDEPQDPHKPRHAQHAQDAQVGPRGGDALKRDVPHGLQHQQRVEHVPEFLLALEEALPVDDYAHDQLHRKDGVEDAVKRLEGLAVVRALARGLAPPLEAVLGLQPDADAIDQDRKGDRSFEDRPAHPVRQLPEGVKFLLIFGRPLRLVVVLHALDHRPQHGQARRSVLVDRART